MPSMHDAPLEQLWLTQSSKSTEKFKRKRANVMIHVESCWLDAVSISFVLYLLFSQCSPENPTEQLHE